MSSKRDILIRRLAAAENNITINKVTGEFPITGVSKKRGGYTCRRNYP